MEYDKALLELIVGTWEVSTYLIQEESGLSKGHLILKMLEIVSIVAVAIFGTEHVRVGVGGLLYLHKLELL
jgi:hypothetical protein